MLAHRSVGALDVLQSWASAGVDLLFPPRCASCGRAGRPICARCAQLVTPPPDALCTRCGRVQHARVARCHDCQDDAAFPLQQVRAAALHVAPLREWIHLLKYEGQRALAPPLARYLTAALASADWAPLRAHIDGVVPAPLHAARLRERGYNQAELLARGLCRQTGLPLRTDLLHRARQTRSQVGLNAVERKANVEDAFTAAPASRGLHLLLIDDVYTTGATLRACANALREAGAAQVSALTLAMPNHLEPSVPHELSHS